MNTYRLCKEPNRIYFVNSIEEAKASSGRNASKFRRIFP